MIACYIVNISASNLYPLIANRNISGVVYFHKILTENINCNQLVSEILLYAPERTLRRNHSRRTFYVKCRTCMRKDS